MMTLQKKKKSNTAGSFFGHHKLKMEGKETTSHRAFQSLPIALACIVYSPHLQTKPEELLKESFGNTNKSNWISSLKEK